jgi:hypothetical protein
VWPLFSNQLWRNIQSVDIWGWCRTLFQSYVMIAITFVSYFISSFQRPIKPPMKLETAKRKPKIWEERKNEEIICRKCLPHHKRASSFVNTYKPARLHFLPILSRYSRMSERVQHDEQCLSLHDRWCFCYGEQCSSLHAEGLKWWDSERREATVMTTCTWQTKCEGRNHCCNSDGFS